MLTIHPTHPHVNYASDQQLPLMAASAILKACWAELSGAVAATAWAFAASHIPIDGLAP